MSRYQSNLTKNMFSVKKNGKAQHYVSESNQSHRLLSGLLHVCFRVNRHFIINYSFMWSNQYRAI